MDLKTTNINEQLKLLSSRQDLLAYFVLAGVLIFSAVKFSSIQKEKVDDLNRQVAEETNKNEVVERISVVEKELQPYKSFFSEKQEAEIINTISNLARDMGVKIISLTPSQVTKEGEFIKRSFDLACDASYHNLGKFVGKLETCPLFIRIEDLNMEARNYFSSQSEADSSKPAVARANFKIHSLFLK